MIGAVALAGGACLAAGIYLMLSRDLLRGVLGLAVLAAAGNLMLFAAGRLESSAPPLVATGATALERAANPLPQALTLTAIVIGLALTCFALVLATRLIRDAGTDDAQALRFAEPDPGDVPARVAEPGDEQERVC